MPTYTSITIIYNPNGTGPSKQLSEDLETQLQETYPKQKIKRIQTKYPGHGEEIAYSEALASSQPLIISVSGDGGYHEVINGLMKAQQEGASPVAGLLPGGNANDHYNALHEEDTVTAITAGKERTVDLLKINATVDGKPYERYGHSYIGIGLTPKAGHELNKTKLNKINEIVIVIKSILFLKPVHIIKNKKKLAYDSLIFSNIDTMSKVMTLSKQARIDDGKFEITGFRRRNKWKLLRLLLHASTRGLDGTDHATRFSFTSPAPLLVQIDGEIIKVDANAPITISSAQTALRCIV